MASASPTLNGVFRALADPTRRAVVERLCEGSASVSELARPFEMALPSFMQHLRVLEDAGLITTRKQGRVRTCQLEPGALGEAASWVEYLRQEHAAEEPEAERNGGSLRA